MDRDEAFTRRVAESTTSESTDDGSDQDEQTYVVREGAVRSVDAEESVARDATGLPEAAPPGMDPTLQRAQRLPEAADVAGAAPDGRSVGRGGLTSPAGEVIGGDSVADAVVGRGTALGGDALGGARLDPLGMLDSSDIDSPTDRDLQRAISRADGSAVSKGTEPAPPPGGGTDPGDAEDPSRADDLNEKWSPKPPGERDGGGPRPAGGGDEPADGDPPEDDVTDEEERPDPNAGYDVVTGANIDTALRGQGIAPYAQPTQDDDSSGAVTTVNLDWAAPGSDPRLTQYGPDGPEAVPADGFVAPTDLIFDPPPEGASVGMAGAAMADPGAALGGGGVIGSSTPDEAPPPPDPPPGGDPGDDPWAPPPGGGEG